MCKRQISSQTKEKKTETDEEVNFQEQMLPGQVCAILIRSTLNLTISSWIESLVHLTDKMKGRCKHSISKYSALLSTFFKDNSVFLFRAVFVLLSPAHDPTLFWIGRPRDKQETRRKAQPQQRALWRGGQHALLPRANASPGGRAPHWDGIFYTHVSLHPRLYNTERKTLESSSVSTLKRPVMVHIKFNFTGFSMSPQHYRCMVIKKLKGWFSLLCIFQVFKTQVRNLDTSFICAFLYTACRAWKAFQIRS